MIRHLLIMAAALGLLAGAAVAHGLQGIEITVDPGDPLAAASQEHQGSLIITVNRDVELRELQLDGDTWQRLSWDRVSGRILGRGERLRVAYRGTPREADDPLHITLVTDEVTITRRIAVGGAWLERAATPIPLSNQLRGFAEPPRHGQPGPSPLPAAAPQAKAEGDGTRRTIRIHGRFLYVRGEAPDQMIMGAEGFTVQVWDGDPGVDDYLGAGVSDRNGDFDFYVSWSPQWNDDDPDIKLIFVAENSEVRIQPGAGAVRYEFEIGGWANFTGTDLDVGVVVPDDENDHGIPHLLTNSVRNWRYCQTRGHDTRFLEVRWPTSSDDGALYYSVSETIFMPRDRTWESAVLAHEYGHHVMNCLAHMPILNYCNGMCDNSSIDCGHCLFCWENDETAWVEGWADYLGHVIPATYLGTYGVEAAGMREIESLEACQDDGTWDDPEITEGFHAALLIDLHDTAQDNDSRTPDGDDRSSYGGQYILDLMDDHERMRLGPFMDDVVADNPDDRQNIWFTAMNNEFDLDEDDPDPVYPIVCMSHTPGTPSANNQLRFTWQEPYDDMSGVEAYVVQLRSAPGDPVNMAQTANLATFDNVAPGTWYFCIRCRDHAGNYSESTHSGPYIITEPQPRNLVFELRDGWGHSVVPSNTTDATLNSCPLPTVLDSGEPTYWNLAGRNQGDLSTGADCITALEIDGVEKDDFNWGNLPGWSPFVVLNDGPELALGGLHSVVGSIDPENVIVETDETDNRTGKQYAWQPPLITADFPAYAASSVPEMVAGWEHVTDWSRYYNCYGVGIRSSGWWNALVAWSNNATADFDVRLHDASTDPQSAYRSSRERSALPAGSTDAVIVNRNVTGSVLWDGAILNVNNSTSSARFAHVTSELVAFGDSLSEVMGDNEYIMLREFELGTYDTGGITIDLWTDPPQAEVLLSWYDQDTETSHLMGGDAVAMTGADGHARLDVVAAETGYTCLSICRRAADGDDPLTVTYRIRATLPDLVTATPSGWHSPVVPRPDETGAPDNVALPSYLMGDADSTWYNFALENSSTGIALGAMRFQVRIDDWSSQSYLHLFDIPAGATRTFNDVGPVTVSGGRHTAVLHLDTQDSVAELDETNNTFGEQYVWRPVTMSTGERQWRAAPRERLAGVEHIGTSEPYYYNCDAVRASDTQAYWRCVAVMPGDTSNVDLRLHEPSAGPKDGFSTWLETSGFGVGGSDYVLVNYNAAPHGDHDVGVVNSGGQQDYLVEVSYETYIGEGETVVGPVTLPADEIMDLYEVWLTAGTWTVRLETLDNVVDWGLSVHPADVMYLGKNDVLYAGLAVFADPGVDEIVEVEVESEGYHAIGVWKSLSADLAATGQYNLHVISGSIVGVDDPPPATSLSAVYPNPFNPQTTVAFDLAKAGHVELAVFDARGRRVATLLDGEQGVGRHRVVWTGQDDRGRRLASGVYLVRMQADGVTDLRKVLMVK